VGYLEYYVGENVTVKRHIGNIRRNVVEWLEEALQEQEWVGILKGKKLDVVIPVGADEWDDEWDVEEVDDVMQFYYKAGFKVFDMDNIGNEPILNGIVYVMGDVIDYREKEDKWDTEIDLFVEVLTIDFKQ
jgi:hypothetical protein